MDESTNVAATHETVLSDIKQNLDTFEKYINLYELDNWLKSIVVEDIKIAFKLASLIEKIVRTLEKDNCTSIFQTILDLTLQSKNHTKLYQLRFFIAASDHLLYKFFTNPSIAINKIDIAVRMYTTLNRKERFKQFLHNLILKSASCTAVVNYSIENKDNINIKQLECRLIQKNWTRDIGRGQMDHLKINITNMLSSYKIEKCLPILIIILTLPRISKEDNQLNKFILDTLVSKMLDTSMLSKKFWYSLFNHVESKYVAIICDQYDDLLDALFAFIIYIGCMMNCVIENEVMKWSGDPSSVCPDLTYENLVSLIKSLSNYNSKLHKYVNERICKSKEGINSHLWTQIEDSL